MLAIDPAKSKPSVGAVFINGKFVKFISFKHKDVISGKADSKISVKEDSRNIAVVETPYIRRGHSIKNQIALAIAVGEIGQWLRRVGHEVVYVPAWGNKKAGGWIQQFFGRRKRDVILRMARQMCKADGIDSVKNDDYSMAYCLGKFWLRNNTPHCITEAK